jgi:salicylate hydroxylase
VARPLRIAVIGGGIGGLTAALALQQSGLCVDVYEQAAEFSEVGAGVSLGPNALTLLRRLGLEAELDAIAARPSGYEMRRGRDGKVLFETHSSGPLREMRPLTMHRGHLLKVLERSVPRERLHPGKRCTRLDERDGEVTVSFDDGSTAGADVVVGADGIHSTVRSTYYDDTPVFSGTIAYRGLIPMDRLPFLAEERHHLTFWFGPRRHLLAFPVARGSLMNVVAFVPAGDGWAEESRESPPPSPLPLPRDPGVPTKSRSRRADFVGWEGGGYWTAPGDVEVLARHFDGWEPSAVGVVRALDSTMRWALYDREPLPAWSFGHVALLGDAAHAMLPHQGQGAVQSIEDAVVLAHCLERAGPADVSEWLKLYERVRKPRAERVQQASRITGEIYRLADADEQERLVPSALRTRGEWLWNYDADQAFEAAVASSGLEADTA